MLNQQLLKQLLLPCMVHWWTYFCFTLFSYCVEGLSSRSLVSSQQVSGHPPNGEFQSCNTSYSIIINYCISARGPQNTLLYPENGLLYLKICLSNNVFAIGIKISGKWNELKCIFQHNASAHSLISSSRGSTCPQCGIVKSTCLTHKLCVERVLPLALLSLFAAAVQLNPVLYHSANACMSKRKAAVQAAVLSHFFFYFKTNIYQCRHSVRLMPCCLLCLLFSAFHMFFPMCEIKQKGSVRQLNSTM